jgi:eukaryotic-like serine/threonine-protein kinase
MDTARWERIKRLLQEALDLPSSARAAFLQQQCGADEDLRREVETMLRDAEAAASFIETPALEQFATTLGQEDLSLIGQTIAHYHIEAELGAGGMGQVFKARDQQLDRHVAIKILPVEFAADPARVRRFEREAYAASALNHPNIVTIHEIGRVELAGSVLPYIAYELVEGQTLRKRLQDSRLGWPEVVGIAIQIVEALKAAHAAGIIHRDIKPENVMLRADERVKVLDFGIAKRLDLQMVDEESEGQFTAAPRQDNSTVTNGLFGTPNYLSPEQARGERIDAATDIFALGMMLYEMLAGSHPFASMSDAQKLAALQRSEELPAIGELRKDIPTALALIVARAIKKARSERYASVEQMIEALNELRPAIERKAPATMQRSLRTQNANRLLNQFVALYATDQQTRLSPVALWTIWRYADIKRGRLERALLRRSLLSALVKVIAIVLLTGALTLGVAAWFSIEDKWEEKILRDGSTAGVRRAIFSPDGRRLVAVGEDGMVRVWDFARRELIKTLENHQASVVAASFAPDGRFFATASWDRTVIVWDAMELTPVITLRDHRAEVTGVAFSPDGRYLASASKVPDERAVLWRAGSWEKVRDLPLYGGDWHPLLFAPNNSRLLFDINKVCDVETGRAVALTVKPENIAAAFSPDGSRVVVARSDGEVFFGDFARQKISGRYPTHRDHGRGAAFSPDGKLVATGAEDIALWNAETRELITRWDYSSYVWNLAWSPDGRYLVSTHGDGSILLWDMVARERVANLNQHSQPVGAVAFAPDGQRVASGSEDRSIIIWNVADNRKEAVLLGHDSRINALAFAPDGTWLVSLDQNTELICWDVAARRVMWRRKSRGGWGLAVSPDGSLIARSWNIFASATGQPLFAHDSSRPGPVDLGFASFSGDGRRLAGASDYIVQMYDTRSWQRLDQRGPGYNTTISFAPDNQHLATGDINGQITLWQAAPLLSLGQLGSHSARIKQIAYAPPDGRWLASVGDDQKLKLWDVHARLLIAEIGTHTAPTLAVAFAPDGNRIVTGEHDRSVRVYTRQRALWGQQWAWLDRVPSFH